MTADDPTVTDVLIAGLTARVTDAELEAASMPPYPTPPSQIPLRDRLLRELAARLPAEEDGPLTITRILARPIPYRSEVASLGRPGYFEFNDAAALSSQWAL